MLFQNMQALGKENLVEYARRLGLDVAKFNKDIASNELKQQIENEKSLGESFGITGTPGNVDLAYSC